MSDDDRSLPAEAGDEPRADAAELGEATDELAQEIGDTDLCDAEECNDLACGDDGEDEYGRSDECEDGEQEEDEGEFEDDGRNEEDDWTGLDRQQGEAEEVHDPGSQSVNARNTKAGRDANFAGRDLHITYVQDVSDVYSLEPLALRTLEKIKSVYLPPGSLSNVEEALEVFRGKEPVADTTLDADFAARRVLVVHGAEHAGKLASALAMTASLARATKARHFIYGRKAHEAGSLIEKVRGKPWLDGSLVLLRDAFERNVSLGELEGAELDQLTEALRTKRSFLVLTTELGEGKLNAVRAPKVRVDLAPPELRSVLINHLRYYQCSEQIEQVINSDWPRLQDLLKTPFHIDRFCEQVQDLPRLDETHLEALARSVGKVDRNAMRLWFESLKSNEMLVAMLAFLFDGLDAAALEELAREAVVRLRSEGFGWVQDPREIGFRSLLTAIRAGGELGDVEFEDASVRNEVGWQVSNRMALLWPVVEPIVAETADRRMWDKPVRRAALGTAVGRLGITDGRKLADALERWARSRGALERKKGDGIASLAGVAMAEALRREPETQHGALLGMMQRWIKSKDPDLVWAAGAAIWRIYQVTPGRATEAWALKLKKDLRVRLRELVAVSLDLGAGTRRRITAEVLELKLPRNVMLREVDTRLYDLGRDIRACAVYALQRIGRVDAADMVAILREWLAEPGPKELREVVHRAAQRTFDELLRLDVEPQHTKYLALLQLLDGIFASAAGSGHVYPSLCRWLASWLRWEGWRMEISSALLEVVNRGGDRSRATLREVLSRWWLLEGSPTEPIACSLIARSYAMDGLLTRLPPLGRCLLVLDAMLVGTGAAVAGTEAAKREEARRGHLERLRAAIESQMEVRVALLGAVDGDPGDERTAGERIPHGIPGHRLLMPVIDGGAARGVAMVLVVTAGPIADLDDAVDALGSAQKVLVSTDRDLEAPPGVLLVPISREVSSKDVAAVEVCLQTHWANALVELAPAAWEPLLAEVGVDTDELLLPEASLCRWADQLDDFSAASGRSDLGRRILSTLFWLAAKDFDCCLRIVRSWLMTEGATTLRRLAGTAAGKALFRTGAHAVCGGGRWDPMRLFDELAAPLALADKDGTEAVIRAVERWLEAPELAAGLAGAVVDGRGRLLRWAEDLAPERAASFQAGLGRYREAVREQDLGSIGSALESAFDRIWMLAGGRPRSLPCLEEGQRYGIIVVDHGAAGDERASGRWRLARSLFQKLDDAKRTGLRPLVYRLGERWPALVAGDHLTDGDLPACLVPQPRLLGTVLSAAVAPRDVAFVLVLADTMWIDGEDWLDCEWRERIVTWKPLPDAPWSAVLASMPLGDGGDSDEVAIALRMLRARWPRAEEDLS